MGIFSNKAHYGYHGEQPFNEDTLESIMTDSNVEPYEGDDLMEGALDCCITMQDNYNMFMTQTALAESSYLERTGELLVYNEGMLGDMVNAIKNFLKKIWEKIKALFKRFMMIIDSYSKNDKEFVNKYKKEIYSGKSLTDFTFKGWKFSDEAANKTATAVGLCTINSKIFSDLAGNINQNEETLKKYEEKYENDLEKARGGIIEILGGKGGSYTSSEFSKELHSVYRSGMDSKEELDDKDIGSITNIASELMNSSTVKKQANKIFKEAKKSIDDDVKDIERRQNSFFKTQPLNKDEKDKTVNVITMNDDKSVKQETITNQKSADRAAKSFNYYLKCTRDVKSILVQLEGAAFNALKEWSRQNKAIIIAYVAHKPKNESVARLAESASLGYTPFSGVVMK